MGWQHWGVPIRSDMDGNFVIRFEATDDRVEMGGIQSNDHVLLISNDMERVCCRTRLSHPATK